MKFTKTQSALKDLGKDWLAIGTGLVGVVVDTAKVPVSMCKDFRNHYLDQKKSKKLVAQKNASAN